MERAAALIDAAHHEDQAQRPAGVWAGFMAFLRDDGTRGHGVARPFQQVARLHRCQRGNVTLLYLLFAIFLFVILALVWNTGRASTAALHAQMAADTSAYSAAVFTSRAVNIITGANMLILQNINASIISRASRGGRPM